MDFPKYIRLCLVQKEISEAALAERLGTSRQNLNLKMRNHSLRESDLTAIAEALGAEVSLKFIDKITGKPII
jgi:transcriptional regulator with XRE-family HTH domain